MNRSRKKNEKNEEIKNRLATSIDVHIGPIAIEVRIRLIIHWSQQNIYRENSCRRKKRKRLLFNMYAIKANRKIKGIEEYNKEV